MKYIMQLSARVSAEQAMEIKHREVIAFLKEMNGDWGIPKDLDAVPPKFGTQIMAAFNLTRKLGKGIRGDVMYRYRNMITDHHSSDDSIWVEFNAKKVDFEILISNVFHNYIRGFKAYKANIFPEELIYQKHDIPFEIRAKLNYRRNIEKFYPFYYLDKDLVKDSLGYTVTELFDLLQGKILSVKILDNGAGIILEAGDNYVGVEDSIAFTDNVCSVLGIKPPSGIIE